MNHYANHQWKNLEGDSAQLQRAVPGESDHIPKENIFGCL